MSQSPSAGTRPPEFATDRQQAEEAIRQSEARFRGLFENMLEGCAVCRMVFEDGRPEDFIYLQVNRAFEELTGLKDAVGKRVTELIPGIRQSNPEVFEIYGRVVRTGRPERFEVYLPPLGGIRLSISAYRREPDCFVAVLSNVTERRQAEDNFREAYSRLERMSASNVVGVNMGDAEGRLFEANDYYLDLLGFTRAEFEAGLVRWDERTPPEHLPTCRRAVEEVLRRGICTPYEKQYIRKDGSRIWVLVADILMPGPQKRILALVMDITDRKMAQDRTALAAEVLGVLNRPNDLAQAIGEILRLVKARLGFEAVGIRLREGCDFPYYVQSGFSEDFLRTEQHLCSHDQAGRPVLDSLGQPVLECMCGNILQGRTDPGKPFFTAAGSFWTNCTTDLIAATCQADRQGKPRNRCNTEGYESVALVPLRSEDGIIGLLQLNDHRRGKLSIELIQFLEGLGASIGVTIKRQYVAQSLREQESRFRQLFEKMSDGVAIYQAVDGGQDFVLVDLNPAGQQAFRVSRDEVLGRRITDVFPTVGEMGLMGVFRRVWRTGQAEQLPQTLYKDARVARWVENYVYRLPSGLLVAIFADVTERMLEERRHGAILETAMDGFWVADAQGRILEINDALCRMSGYSREELLRMSLADLEAVETSKDVADHIARIKADGTDRFETRHRRKDGRIIDVEISATRMGDPTGQVFAFGRDITEQKRAHALLFESQERFRALVESVTDYIYTVQIADGRVVGTYHSPGCLGVTGYTPQDYQADEEVWIRMVHEEDRPALWDLSRKLLAGLKVPPLEHRIVHKSGDIRWVRNTPVLRYDQQGRFIGYDGLVQDITEQRKLLEQWLQSQKMEAVGLLAGGIAHDFRNQLTVIRGYAEMLIRRGMVPQPALEPLREVLKAADRSAELSAQLLAFSRQQELRPEVVSLDDLIRDMSKSLVRMVGEDIRLSIVPSPSCRTVRVDPGQFHQAMMNLVVNARDAMPRGGLLTIEVCDVELGESFAQQRPGTSPGPHVMVAVTDTGTGIAKEALQRIFEPFFTTKPVGQGTGLGLAMVYGFVRQSGGCVLAESEPGHGATFRIYLPATAETAKAARADAAGPAELPRGKGTVLVVEDELAILDLLVSTLEECGYTVLRAAGSAEALAAAANCEGTIDLLISDVVMPEMSGPDMAAKFLAARPGTPLLYLSGYTGQALANHGAVGPQANLLTKPFTTQALMQAVQALLPAAG